MIFYVDSLGTDTPEPSRSYSLLNEKWVRSIVAYSVRSIRNHVRKLLFHCVFFLINENKKIVYITNKTISIK